MLSQICIIWEKSKKYLLFTKLFQTFQTWVQHLYMYYIYPKYWDTLTPYYTGPKILNKSILLPVNKSKLCWMICKLCGPFCSLWAVSTHCVLRNVCPNA